MTLYLLLLLQLLLIAFVILALNYLKPRISLAPLFIFLGSIQYAQQVLASSLYYEIFGGLSLSAGSVIFFAANLFAILLIYIKEGVVQTRTLIAGIVVSNVTLTLLGAITSLAVSNNSQAVAVSVHKGFFDVDYWLFILGTITLILDAFLLAIVYQFLVNKAKLLKMFGGIAISLLAVLYFDSIVFSVGGFYGTPQFTGFLISQLAGKTVSGLLFGVILYSYLRFVDTSQMGARQSIPNEPIDVFSILTYREKFDGLESNSTAFERGLSEQLLSTLDTMSDGYVSFDADWRFTYLNNAIRQIGGTERADGLIGKKFWDEYPELIGNLFYENCHLAVATNEQYIFEHYSEMFNVWFMVRAIPSANGLSVFLTDITEKKNAEREIDRSNKRNEALLNAIPDLLFGIDKDGVFIDFHNPHDRETLVSLQDYIGANVVDIIPPKLAAETLENVRKCLETGEIIVHYYELTVGGSKRFCEARYVKNSDTDVFSVVRDITAEQETETALKKTEAKYQALVNQASDGILLHDFDGNVLEMNDAALRFAGYAREDIAGTTLANYLFLEDLEDLPFPFDRLKNGETTGTRRRIRRKDGSAIWMEIRSRMNDEGNVIAIVRDVTEKLAMEKEVIESENLFRTLMESAPIGIFQTTLDGKCTYVNDQWLKVAGITFQEALGSGWQKGIHPEDRERVYKERVSSIDNDEEFYSSFRWQAPDGKVTETEVRAVTVSDHKGEKLGFIGTVTDVTKQKKADAELKIYREQLEELVQMRTSELEIEKVKAQSADKLKSAFLATMSHELRTPLNSIIGFTGLLINELAGPINDEQKKQLGMVKNSGRHLLSLINDILDLSKIEAGEMSVSKDSYELLPSIERVIEIVQPLADAKDLRLTFEVTPENIQFVSDVRRVEQILINLLDNAVKFTESGSVILKCSSDGKILTFTVKDTGIGIQTKDIKKLFVPFSQLDSGLTRNHQGTGLGLSISQKLVKMLGGTISVKSEFGSGSEFNVRFPVRNGAIN